MEEKYIQMGQHIKDTFRKVWRMVLVLIDGKMGKFMKGSSEKGTYGGKEKF